MKEAEASAKRSYRTRAGKLLHFIIKRIIAPSENTKEFLRRDVGHPPDNMRDVISQSVLIFFNARSYGIRNRLPGLP